MSVERGKIVVIEGGDSSGKEVQSKKLTEVLQNKGYPVRYLDFPRYDQFFGSLIGRYLRGEFGEAFNVHPALAALPYSLDRAELKDSIIESVNNGEIVVCNRYTGSGLAFMSAKLSKEEREDFVKWLEEMEYGKLGVPKEDLSIFLHVPAKVGQRLTYAKDEKEYMKGKGRGDIHERNLVYLSNVIEQYLWLSKNRRQWVEIFCMVDENALRPIDDIHGDIMQILKDRGIIKNE